MECARSVGLALRGVHIELNVLAFWDMREEDGTFREFLTTDKWLLMAQQE